MKTTRYFIALTAVALLVSGCGGGSSSSNGSTAVPTATVQITSSNAASVAKGSMAPSQSVAKQGSSGAAAVGVVVQAGATRKSVMDIALAQAKRFRDMKASLTPTVVGVSLTGFPVTAPCGTSGNIVLDLQGATANATTASSFSMTFNACVDPNPVVVGATSTINGTISFAVNASNGVITPTVSAPLTESVTMSFTSFSVVDTSTVPADTQTMNGAITMDINDNGTSIVATMSGASFSSSSTQDGAFTMKDFAITQTEDSPSLPLVSQTGNYSFTVAMTTHCAAINGDVVITTPIPFRGNGTGEPTSGKMVISGTLGSSLTLTANAPVAPATVGDVTMVVNDGTNPPVTSTVSWAQI